MDAEEKFERAQRRAEQAKRLLADAMLVDVLTGIEERCMAAWRGSDPGNAEVREEAYHLLRAVDAIRTEIGEIASGAVKMEINQAPVGRRRTAPVRARRGFD